MTFSHIHNPGEVNPTMHLNDPIAVDHEYRETFVFCFLSIFCTGRFRVLVIEKKDGGQKERKRMLFTFSVVFMEIL